MDYNIYIHDKSDQNGKPTQPRKETESDTAPKADQDAEGGEAAFSGLGWIAVAIAAAKVADAAVTTMLPFQARETGDYSRQYAYNDFKTGVKLAIGVVTNPVGTAYRSALAVANLKQTEAIEEKRKSRERSLLGDALINSWSGSI